MDGRKRYENDTKAISVDANRFENGVKQYRFHLKTVECGWGLSYTTLVVRDTPTFYKNPTNGSACNTSLCSSMGRASDQSEGHGFDSRQGLIQILS